MAELSKELNNEEVSREEFAGVRKLGEWYDNGKIFSVMLEHQKIGFDLTGKGLLKLKRKKNKNQQQACV